MSWQEVDGNPRPFAVIVTYKCSKAEWGYASNGENKVVSRCDKDGTWNVTFVEPCISKLSLNFNLNIA